MHTHRHQSYAHTNTPICTHICLLARAVSWGLAYDPINNYAPINVMPHYCADDGDYVGVAWAEDVGG